MTFNLISCAWPDPRFRENPVVRSSSTPTRIGEWSYDPVDIKWYADGQLNICHNALDRHVAAGKGDVTALIFEPDSPDGEVRKLTYAELLTETIRMANTLKAMGVRKGDRVTIYMPMIPEGAIAMLACARIGAIHSVVFGGFSPDAIAGRIDPALVAQAIVKFGIDADKINPLYA